MKEWEGMFQNQSFVLGMPELPQGVAVMEILEAHSSARNLMADGSYMALWVGLSHLLFKTWVFSIYKSLTLSILVGQIYLVLKRNFETKMKNT